MKKYNHEIQTVACTKIAMQISNENNKEFKDIDEITTYGHK